MEIECDFCRQAWETNSRLAWSLACKSGISFCDCLNESGLVVVLGSEHGRVNEAGRRETEPEKGLTYLEEVGIVLTNVNLCFGRGKGIG